MRNQVLLISYVESDLASLRHQLQICSPEASIETAVNMRQGFQKLAETPTEMIVMNFEVLSEVVAKHVRNMKSVVGRVPLLILGKVERSTILSEVAQMNRTVILDKPFTMPELQGLAHKVVNLPQVSQQFHRRYLTNQSAQFEIFGKSVASSTTLLNLSRGGAFMEIPNDEDIAVGDLLRLDVPLGRNHRMHARVVWATDQTASGKLGIGVKFISATEVYREMQSR